MAKREITKVNTDMKMGFLKQQAKEVGFTYKVGMTKEVLVEGINQAMLDNDPNVEEVLVSPAETVEVPEAEVTEPSAEEEVPETDKLEESDVKPATKEEKPVKEKGPSKRELEEQYVRELKAREDVQKVLEAEKTKADVIRSLLGLGIERKYVAKVLDIRYQMVYQVEQRMIATAAQEELRKQAIEMKDVIRQLGSKANEEYGEELIAEVEKLIAEEEKAAKKAAKEEEKAE